MAASLTGVVANSVFTVVVKCQEDQKTVNDQVSVTPSAGSPGGGGGADVWTFFRDLGEYFEKVAIGAKSVSLEYSDGVATALATGTITFTGNPANNDTITIGGVLITLVSGTPSGSQVKIGATQAATMAAIVTFINNNGSSNNLIGLVNATLTSATVITINSDYPGLVGNLITMSKVCANISAITSPLAGGALVTQAPIVSAGL